MKAIETFYRGPTNTRGSRIYATDMDNNRVSIPYPHQLDSEAAHQKAALTLRDKMGWDGELIGGNTKRGYAWVFVNQSTRKTAR